MVLSLVAVTSALVPVAVNAGTRVPRTTCTNTTVLDTWSLPTLIRQVIVVPIEAPQIAQAGSLFKAGYGGVILFGATGPSNFAAELNSLRATVPNDAGIFVMTDDEGGGVWRLSNLLKPLPWARTMAQIMTAAQITAAATSAAKAMVKLGITMDLAPVLDIDGKNVWPGATDADGYRSFSGNGSVVAVDGTAFMKGLIAGGVVPVIKHFPGLGGVSPNTDDGAASTAPWATVQKVSLPPFVAAVKAGAPALMMSNATVPGLTTGPATLSSAAYNAVRTTLNFKGLIITDSLSAGAISAVHLSVPQASAVAVSDGAQMVLFGVPTKGTVSQMATAILNAIFSDVATGTISRTTLVNDDAAILKTRGVNLCSTPG
jgi:beta-N-acetylhexosaminidase